MSTGYVNGPTRTFQANAALGQHIRVKLSSGKLVAAGVGASDEPVELGTLEIAALAADAYVPVRLRNATGTCRMVAGAAIAAGANVYGAANGKIDDTVSGAIIGIALEAAGADGDVIEVLRY